VWGNLAWAGRPHYLGDITILVKIFSLGAQKHTK
jgi:hypothetical protein